MGTTPMVMPVLSFRPLSRGEKLVPRKERKEERTTRLAHRMRFKSLLIIIYSLVPYFPINNPIYPSSLLFSPFYVVELLRL